MRKIDIVYKVTIGILLVTSSIAKTCDYGETEKYDPVTKSQLCVPCGTGCSFCQVFGDEVTCSLCRYSKLHGYFMTNNRQCNLCAKGCKECSGESPEQCSTTASGYYFDPATKSILKCKEGCATCDSIGNCLACAPGNLATLISSKGETTNYSCNKCADTNCDSCLRIDAGIFMSYQSCSSCKRGYGMNGGLCQKCPENCQICKAGVCLVCSYGYSSPEENKTQCNKIQTDNCEDFDHTTNKCNSCRYGYFLDKNGICSNCSLLDSACNFCRKPLDNELAKNTGVSEFYRSFGRCLTCSYGYNVNESNGTCVKNAEHCLIVSSDGVCIECSHGFYPSGKLCTKITEPSCIVQDSNGCTLCNAGYYSKSGKCNKCDSSCLTCSGPSANECISCSIFKYKTQTKAKQTSDFWTLLQNTRCLDECPTEEEFKYQVSDATRECIVTKEKQVSQHKDIEFTHSEDQNKNGYTILFDAMNFVKTYNHYIEQEQMEIMKNNKTMKDNGLDDFCSRRGKLRERLSAERETFYECICDDGTFGTSCEISSKLYHAANKFSHQLLQEVLLS